MKKQESKNTTCFLCTRSQRLWAAFALMGLFICGIMVGMSVFGKHGLTSSDKPVVQEQEARIHKVRNFMKKQHEPCEMREEALLPRIVVGDDLSVYDHENNVKIYSLLAHQGCPENQQKFADLTLSEASVVSALRIADGNVAIDSGQPCAVIEQTLLNEICNDYSCHLHNAEVYSKMSEDGCPENSEIYKQKALNELQIADGIRVNEDDLSRGDIRATVNTYKKLQMQNEARKYIKKAEKLINPGVDFIMELERVIEE